MVVNFEYKNKYISANVSENNGLNSPIVSLLSHQKLLPEERKKVKKIAIQLAAEKDAMEKMEVTKSYHDMTIEELESLSKHIGEQLDIIMKGDKLYELYRYTPEKFKEKYFPICNELFGPITDFDAVSETLINFTLSDKKKASVKISRKTRKVLKSSFHIYE